MPGQVDGDGFADVFVFDRVAGTTELISRAAGSTATAGNGNSAHSTISPDGRFVAFESYATDLAPGTSFRYFTHVFLFDRMTGTCELVTRRHDSAAAGSSAGGTNAVAGAGGVVAFISLSVDLVAGFPPQGSPYMSDWPHAYAYERATAQVTLVNHEPGSSSAPMPGAVHELTLSANGRYVTFGAVDLHLHDRKTGVNVEVAPFISSYDSKSAAVSDDGQWVSFTSNAPLIPGVPGGQYQVYLYDVQSAALALVSRTPVGPLAAGNGACGPSNISGDGRYVTYFGYATDLVAGFADGNGPGGLDAYLYDRVTGETALASRQAGSAVASGNASVFYAPKLSGDGRYVAFASAATDHVAGFVDGNGSVVYAGGGFNGYDVFRFDRVTGATDLVSGKAGSPVLSANADTRFFDLSAGGNVVTVNTTATDAVAGLPDANGTNDLVVRDLAAGTAVMASKRNAVPSLTPGGDSQNVHQTPDGRFVAFTSKATNVVPGQVDTEQSPDVFLFDRTNGTTILVSRAAGTATTAGDGGSANPAVSADGRYVAFCSFATDLVAEFVNSNGAAAPGYGLTSGTDVFLFDRLTGTTVLVSRQAGTASVGGNGTSGSCAMSGGLAISDDGRFVSYGSAATDLVAGFVDNNGPGVVTHSAGVDVFVFDRLTGANLLVSQAAGNPLAGGTKSAHDPSMSGDGRFVTFWSRSTNLIANMSGGTANIFVHDRLAGTTALVSHAHTSPTASGNGGSDMPVFSRDGNFIVYQSGSNNLIAGTIDSNNDADVFLYDRATGVNTLVSHTYTLATRAGNVWSSLHNAYSPVNSAISADGRFVVYASGAGDLVTGFVDNNGVNLLNYFDCDVFLFDRLTGLNMLVSHTSASATAGGNRTSRWSSVSGDGRFVTYLSHAADLVAGLVAPEGAVSENVFRYDRRTGLTTLLSHAPGDPLGPGLGHSSTPAVSHDGAVVTFASTSANLVSSDFNSFADVFSHVTPPPRVQSVQVADGSAQRSTVRSLTVAFDQPVTFAGSPDVAFRLLRNGVVVSGQWSAVSQVNPSTFTITFTGLVAEFGSLIDGSYRLEVLAGQVSNIGQLDGNGDGVGGDDYAFTFHRLFGDADGDRTVGPLDFAALRAAFGSQSLAFDFDNDGDADAADFFQFRRRFGSSV